MSDLSHLTVLVVDPAGNTGFSYRASFIDAGAEAHVVGNFSAAELFIANKKFDAVVLPYAQDGATIAYCKLLVLKNIPYFFTSEPPTRCTKRNPMSDAIVAVHAILAAKELAAKDSDYKIVRLVS